MDVGLYMVMHGEVPVPVVADVGTKSLPIYQRLLQEYGEFVTQPRVEQWVQVGVFPGVVFLGNSVLADRVNLKSSVCQIPNKSRQTWRTRRETHWSQEKHNLHCQPKQMEQTLQKPRIHVITDSRGVNFQTILSKDIISDQIFCMTVISGARLQNLTECATRHQAKYELQIIAGGICDITKKEGNYITFSEDSGRLPQLEKTIKSARAALGAKLLFANIPYAHVEKHNNFKYNCVKRKGKGVHISPPPVTLNQKALEEEVRRANAIIEEEGTSQDLPTIKLDHALICNSSKRKNRSKKQTVKTGDLVHTSVWWATCWRTTEKTVVHDNRNRRATRLQQHCPSIVPRIIPGGGLGGLQTKATITYCE